MSKILSPKAWYLVGAGAVALVADSARRLVKRRRSAGSAGFGSDDAPVVVATAEAKPTPAPAKPAAKKSPAPPDDLTRIKGIGPAFAKRLTEAGYLTYADVAGASADALREATHAPAIANPEEWIVAARELL